MKDYIYNFSKIYKMFLKKKKKKKFMSSSTRENIWEGTENSEKNKIIKKHNILRWNKAPLRSGSTIYQVSFFISLQ